MEPEKEPNSDPESQPVKDELLPVAPEPQSVEVSSRMSQDSGGGQNEKGGQWDYYQWFNQGTEEDKQWYYYRWIHQSTEEEEQFQRRLVEDRALIEQRQHALEECGVDLDTLRLMVARSERENHLNPNLIVRNRGEACFSKGIFLISGRERRHNRVYPRLGTTYYLRR